MKNKKYNILSISFDKSVLDITSDTFRRQKSYSEIVSSYNIITLTSGKKVGNYSSGNLLIVPTNSVNKLFYIVDAIIIAYKLAKKINFSLITVQDPFITGIVGVILSKMLKIPLNVQIHSEFFNTVFFRKESLNNLLLYHLGLIVIPFATTIRPRNHRISEDIISRFPKFYGKSFLVPMGINDVYLSKPSKKKREKYYIVTNGRLSKQKNYILFLKVVKRLSDLIPGLRVDIIGVGELKDEVLSLIKKLKLLKTVRLLGWKSPTEICSILDKASLFLLTSNHEGKEIAVQEALARQIPIVKTATGSADELVVNNRTGAVVPIGDLNCLLRKSIDILMEPSKFNKYSKLGRAKVLKECSPKNVKKLLLKMYADTLSIYNDQILNASK